MTLLPPPLLLLSLLLPPLLPLMPLQLGHLVSSLRNPTNEPALMAPIAYAAAARQVGAKFCIALLCPKALRVLLLAEAPCQTWFGTGFRPCTHLG
jgi:hypothetical protein